MKEVGGPGYLAQLTGSSAAIIGVIDFAEQVRELAHRRQMIEGFRQAIAAAADCTSDMDEVLADADGLLTSLGNADEATEVSAADAVGEVLRQFDEPVNGVTCGSICDIDRLVGPARRKKLMILGGRPGMSKTATAISYCLGAAQRGHGVLFISLEMGADELGGRIAADLCFSTDHPVPYETINDRRATIEQVRQISRARERIAKLPLRIVDRGSLTCSQLDVLIRRYKRRFAAMGIPLELVVVDYLQLMRPDQRMGSNYEAVSEISKRLKQSAKTHDVAVMALAQLSRKVEERPDKRPHLSDLKESGQIEQDADVVLFLYRAAYYAEAQRPDPNSPELAEWLRHYEQIKHRLEFILAKRRDGRRGNQTGYFFGEHQAVRGSDFYLERGRT
jgi:replicative DNA helicase